MRHLYGTFMGTFLLCLICSAPAVASPCTDGVDCYCDRVQGGNLNDTKLLFCEDFEANTLHDNVGFGNGAPNYGPWYDDTGNPGLRGNNSYWAKRYGFVIGGCAIEGGTPSSPQVGSRCSFGLCAGAEYRADNLWQHNNVACIDIIRNGEFDDDVGSLSSPLEASGGGTGVFDGRQSFGYRIRQGSTNGIVGTAQWNPVTEVGLTLALAYASNLGGVSLIDDPWKHEEWYGPDSDPGGNWEPWHLMNTGMGTNAVFPYRPILFTRDASDCQAAVANATALIGSLGCNGPFVIYGARFGTGQGQYSQAADFPFGTWGCHQAHMQGMGTNNVTIRIWHNGELIIHITGLDGRRLINKSYSGFFFNAYANANQGLGETPTSQTTFRYLDNIHVRNGAPVSCSQIGYAGGIPSDSTPPASPTNLQVQ